MDAQETLHYIDTLLFELGYTDDRKEIFDQELFDGIENLYKYIKELETYFYSLNNN